MVTTRTSHIMDKQKIKYRPLSLPSQDTPISTGDETLRVSDSVANSRFKRSIIFLLKKCGILETVPNIQADNKLDINDIIYDVQLQRSELIKYLNYNPRKIYMGPLEYKAIFNSAYINSGLLNINTSYERIRNTSDNNTIYTYYGLTIIVVPWMEGVLVMPDDPDPIFKKAISH